MQLAPSLRDYVYHRMGREFKMPNWKHSPSQDVFFRWGKCKVLHLDSSEQSYTGWEEQLGGTLCWGCLGAGLWPTGSITSQQYHWRKKKPKGCYQPSRWEQQNCLKGNARHGLDETSGFKTGCCMLRHRPARERWVNLTSKESWKQMGTRLGRGMRKAFYSCKTGTICSPCPGW